MSNSRYFRGLFIVFCDNRSIVTYYKKQSHITLFLLHNFASVKDTKRTPSLFDVANLLCVFSHQRLPNPVKMKIMQDNKNVQIVVNRDDLKFMFTEWIQEELNKRTKKQEVYLSRTKTALMLGVTLSTLWRWDKENYLTPVRVGGKVLYRESDIQKVINQTEED